MRCQKLFGLGGLRHSNNTIIYINDFPKLVLPYWVIELLKLFEIVLNYTFFIFLIKQLKKFGLILGNLNYLFV